PPDLHRPWGVCSCLKLDLRVAHGTGMQLYVPDVADAGEVHHHALEAQAETGVAAGAVAAQVQVPPVVLGVETQLVHALLQHLDTLLTLGAADDLADAGHKAVGSGHGLTIVVETHVEGLRSEEH